MPGERGQPRTSRARSAVERERRASRVAHGHAPLSNDFEQGVVRRFAEAWRAADIDGLVRLLAEDALLTMPPEPLRVVGREAIATFLCSVPAAGRLDRFRLAPTRANRQPALAAYLEERATEPAHALAVLVLSIEDDAITSVCRFGDVRLFARLELPPSITPA